MLRRADQEATLAEIDRIYWAEAERLKQSGFEIDRVHRLAWFEVQRKVRNLGRLPVDEQHRIAEEYASALGAIPLPPAGGAPSPLPARFESGAPAESEPTKPSIGQSGRTWGGLVDVVVGSFAGLVLGGSVQAGLELFGMAVPTWLNLVGLWALPAGVYGMSRMRARGKTGQALLLVGGGTVGGMALLVALATYAGYGASSNPELEANTRLLMSATNRYFELGARVSSGTNPDEFLAEYERELADLSQAFDQWSQGVDDELGSPSPNLGGSPRDSVVRLQAAYHEFIRAEGGFLAALQACSTQSCWKRASARFLPAMDAASEELQAALKQISE